MIFLKENSYSFLRVLQLRNQFLSLLVCEFFEPVFQDCRQFSVENFPFSNIHCKNQYYYNSPLTKSIQNHPSIFKTNFWRKIFLSWSFNFLCISFSISNLLLNFSMSFNIKHKKEKNHEVWSTHFMSVILDAFGLIFKKVIQLNEAIIHNHSKSRIINLSQQNISKHDRKSENALKLKNQISSFKEQFQQMYETLDEFRKSNIMKEEKYVQFSPIEKYNYEDEKDHQMILIQQKLDNGLKNMEDRCQHIEDDLGEILLLCKETVLKK